MRPALHAAVLVCLVTLGGCAGLLAAGDAQPPGVTDQGVENATALADAHTDTLRAGYRVERVTTYRAANGTVLQEVHATTRWSPTAHRMVADFEQPHRVLGTHADLYGNDTGTWIQIEPASGDTKVESGPRESSRPLVAAPRDAWSAVYTMAAARDVTVASAENETTRIQFTGANYGGGNATGTMYATSDGFVTHYEITYDATWRGHDVRIHTSRTYTQSGSPNVTTPGWLATTTSTNADG